MTLYVHLVGDSETRVWQLSGRQRLKRSLDGYANVHLVASPDEVPDAATFLALRADYLYDGRVLTALTAGSDALTLVAPDGRVVAVRGESNQARQLTDQLDDAEQAPSDTPCVSPEELTAGSRTALRSLAVARVEPIKASERRRLEQYLFSGSYKGVTDLVTKWLWPRPAQLATRFCLSLGVNPNAVTLMSLILAILAALAFIQGAFITGLLAGWLMTFLDTVDGKLARVSISSSEFGNRLDHGLDLVHPPFWYWAWGLGLSGAWQLTPSFAMTIVLIFATYIAGRLCEGGFRLLAPFSLFLWQPFDSVNRLITARRNPNLLLLTGSFVAGRPDIGLWLVAMWHLISTVILGLRLAWATWLRARGRALSSWLDTVDPATDRDRWVVRLFTQVPPQS